MFSALFRWENPCFGDGESLNVGGLDRRICLNGMGVPKFESEIEILKRMLEGWMVLCLCFIGVLSCLSRSGGFEKQRGGF